mmetsp:Transcript_59939/g.147308  ORF Transcript_59939/g.147308 Transcript_59939/m.147308 type:complete len:212 (+) Transcript_59939:1609-2244(+)
MLLCLSKKSRRFFAWAALPLRMPSRCSAMIASFSSRSACNFCFRSICLALNCRGALTFSGSSSSEESSPRSFLARCPRVPRWNPPSSSSSIVSRSLWRRSRRSIASTSALWLSDRNLNMSSVASFSYFARVSSSASDHNSRRRFENFPTSNLPSFDAVISSFTCREKSRWKYWKADVAGLILLSPPPPAADDASGATATQLSSLGILVFLV